MKYNYFVDISSWFFIIFLLGTFVRTVVSNFIDWTNSDKGNLNPRLKSLHAVHPLMKKFFTRAKVTRTQEYINASESISEMNETITGAASSLFILFGLMPFVIHTLMGWMPGINMTWIYLAYFSVMILIKAVFSIPFAYYDTFHIEQRFGFNNMTKSLFFTDFCKCTAISLIMMCICVTLGNYVLTEFGPFGTDSLICIVLGLVVFQTICEFVSNTVIMGMFNKFTPLKDKKVLSRLKRLLKDYGYENYKICTMDASKRSTKGNAFICGFGKHKKIVLFDTILKKFTTDELVAILGHELAHGKLGHLSRCRLLSLAYTIMYVFATFSLVYNPELYHAFGFTWVDETNVVEFSMLGVLVSSMLIGSVSWILTPLEAFISSRFEYAADRMSVLKTRKREAMVSALIKLTSDNLGDTFPSPAYEAYNYDHPSLVNRIKAIRNIKLGGNTRKETK